MSRRGLAHVSMSSATAAQVHTTAGVIAIGNLHAQIDGQRRDAVAGLLTVRARAGFIDLVTLRGHILGRIADNEWANELADRLVHDAPTDGEASLARARTRATFHLFDDALNDVAAAERLGAGPASVSAQRAAIYQAIGHYEPARTIYNQAVERRADFKSLGDLASLYAERGETAAAEKFFSASRQRYCGVSPIPIAQLDFRRAQMWMAHGDLSGARRWLETVACRLPSYAPAAGHLSEIEAAAGETEASISRLLPLTRSSDDPYYAAQLARILGEDGRMEESGAWRAQAAARYDELVARHPAAFADHAAAFWLDVGADPDRAMWLAKMNHEVRPTRRAHELFARATLAAEVGAHHCVAATPEVVA